MTEFNLRNSDKRSVSIDPKGTEGGGRISCVWSHRRTSYLRVFVSASRNSLALALKTERQPSCQAIGIRRRIFLRIACSLE